MKAEGWISRGIAALLGFGLAFGAVGSLATAFLMQTDSLARVGLVCGLFSLAAALCFCGKWGIRGLLCLLALILGYLWRSGSLPDSFRTLALTVTQYYDRAYGWGLLGSQAGPVDMALILIGCLISLCTVWTVCRQKNALPAITLALIPLMACLVVTDSVPATAFLFLLILGLLLLILTNHLRRGYPSQANVLTAMAALPAALTLVILFAAIPRESYVNRAQEQLDSLIQWAQELPQRAEAFSQELLSQLEGSSRPETVDLANQGPRELLSAPVMDVVPGENGSLYLREQSYDLYSGTGWSMGHTGPERFGKDRELDWVNIGVVTVATRRTRDVLYLPYYPQTQVTLWGGSLENEENTSVYEFPQCRLPENWQNALENRQEWPLQGYLDLPQDTESWARELLETVLTGERTATEKAQTIAAFVRNSAEYDLDTEKMPRNEQDFARWFLEDSETGYCVHFATAATVLLRGAGVQSRYVTGYMAPGIQGQPVTVTGEHAHAWTEYYEPRLGLWIPLEATPGAGTAPDPLGTEPENGTETLPGEENTGETAPVQTQPPETGPGEATVPQQGDTGPLPWGNGEASEGGSGEAAGNRWVFPVILLLSLLILFLQAPVRMALRLRRRTHGEPNRRCLALWQEAEQWAGALGTTPPEALEQLAQKAKYSPHTLTEEELSQFLAFFRTARTALWEKPLAVQLWHRWLRALP